MNWFDVMEQKPMATKGRPEVLTQDQYRNRRRLDEYYRRLDAAKRDKVKREQK